MLVVNGMTPRAAYEGFFEDLDHRPRTRLLSLWRSDPATQGAHDRLVRQAMAERVRSLKPGSRLSVFAESGHSPSTRSRNVLGVSLPPLSQQQTRPEAGP